VARLALKDRAQDRLGAALAAEAVTMYLDDVAEFASTKLTPPFLVIIDAGNTKEEIVLVTAVNETTKALTIERDMLGTTDVAHAKGALVVHTGNPVVFNVKITDISSAETLHLMPPKCVVVQMQTVLEKAITVADAGVKLTKNGTDMTAGAVVIATASSAEGDVDICHPTANTEFNGTTDYLEVVGDGGSTTASVVMVTIIAMME